MTRLWVIASTTTVAAERRSSAAVCLTVSHVSASMKHEMFAVKLLRRTQRIDEAFPDAPVRPWRKLGY